MEDIIKDLHHDLQEKQATIDYSNMPRIYANPTLIRQVFQNLITNAIKFRKDIPPIVKISAIEKEKEWEFLVQDNGIGFDEHQGKKIFQIFQRAVSTDAYEGTGIGLAICKKVVEKHGGTIWVKSAPNIGSTFHFTIRK